MPDSRRWNSRLDIVLILFFCMIAGIIWLFLPHSSASADHALVHFHGQLIGQIGLDEDGYFIFNECPSVTFEVKDGKVAFYSSDCGDKTCIRTGFLTHSGQSAVCLPNELVLSIEGDDAPDIIIR